MNKHFFLFEHLIIIFWLINAIINQLHPHDHQTTLLYTWISLMLLKYKFEGFQLTYFLYFIVEALLYFQVNTIMAILSIGFFYYHTTFLVVYDYPKVTGPFPPGYRNLILDDKTHVAVFYPAASTTHDTTYSENLSMIDRAHDMASKRFPIPKFIFYLTMSFVKNLKLGVNKDAPIAIPDSTNSLKKSFPVIIFNHALGSSNMLYTHFFREWASRGYVILSFDTDELVRTPCIGPADPVRFFQIENRYQQLEKVLDFVTDKLRYQKLFGVKIDLDSNSISLGGHSFGAAAVTLAAYRSERITGACILFDPWLWPLDISALQKPLGKPLLLLRSQVYADKNKQWMLHEKNSALVKSNNKFAVSCYFNGTGHMSPSDSAYFFPVLTEKSGEGTKASTIEDVSKMTNELVDIFLGSVLEQEQRTLSSREVIEKFRKLVEHLGYPNLLRVDEM